MFPLQAAGARGPATGTRRPTSIEADSSHLGSEFSLGNDAHELVVTTRATPFAPATELLLLPPPLACVSSRSTRKKKRSTTLLLLSRASAKVNPASINLFKGFLGSVATDARVLSGFGSPEDSKQASTGKGQRGNCGCIIFAKQTVRSHGIWWLGLDQKRLLSRSAKIQNLIRFEFPAYPPQFQNHLATDSSNRSHKLCGSWSHPPQRSHP